MSLEDRDKIRGYVSMLLIAVTALVGIIYIPYPNADPLGMSILMVLNGLIVTYYFGVQSIPFLIRKLLAQHGQSISVYVGQLLLTENDYRTIVMFELLGCTIIFIFLSIFFPNAKLTLTYFGTLTVASFGQWLGTTNTLRKLI